MNTPHTPGAWYVEHIQNRPFIVDATTKNFGIAEVHGINPATAEANAALLVAAPDLLEALESFLRAPSVGSNGPGSATIVVQDFNLKAARAAIAKAKGGA